MNHRLPAPSVFDAPKTKVRRIIVLLVETETRGQSVELFTDSEAASSYCRELLRRSGSRRKLVGLSLRELIDLMREKFAVVESWERRLAV